MTTNDQFAGSWWGQKWIEALERLSTAWQNRLPRGRDYATKGHVISLSVGDGKIHAKVQGSRSKPYATAIELPIFRNDEWDDAIAHLAAQARFPAQLLTGEMPRGIDDVFNAFGLNLFPARNSEMMGSCTCPDKARPCKHIAAVHYAFGEALDRDPFLLFQLRGANRDRLLKGFQKAWVGSDEVEETTEGDSDEHSGNGVAIMAVSADRFNRCVESIEGMAFRVAPSTSASLILRRLGPPKSWQLPINISDLLGPVYEETARLALEIALSQDTSSSEDSDQWIVDEEVDTPVVPQALTDDRFKSLDIATSLSDALNATESVDISTAGPRSVSALLPSTIGRMKSPSREARQVQETPSSVVIRRSPKIRRRSGSQSEEMVMKPAQKGITAALPVAPPRDTSGPSIVRRGARRMVVPTASGGGPTRERRGADALDRAASKAVDSGDLMKAMKFTIDAWRAKPTIDRLVRMLQSVDGKKTRARTISNEADRALTQAVATSEALNRASIMLLMIAGRLGTVAEIIDSLGPAAWTDDEDCQAEAFIAIAAVMATRGRSYPRRSMLFHVCNELLPDISDPQIGKDVVATARKSPPNDAETDRLLTVATELLQHRCGGRSNKAAADKLATLVVAMAEAMHIVRNDIVASAFLDMCRDAAPKTGVLNKAVARESTASSILA